MEVDVRHLELGVVGGLSKSARDTASGLRRVWLGAPTTYGKAPIERALTRSGPTVFIKHSPLLDQLAVNYAGESELFFERLFESLMEINVRDLQITVDPYNYQSHSEDSPLPSVRRLTLSSSTWSDYVSYSQEIWLTLQAYPPPGLPNVEILFLDYSPLPTSSQIPISPSRPPTTLRAQAITPRFARHLHTSSKLRTIHTIYSGLDTLSLGVFDQLDEIEGKAGFNGIIRSYVHGDGNGELLHARFLSRFIEVFDEPCQNEDEDDKEAPSYIYQAADGTLRFKVFDRLAEPVWQDFTHFGDGLTVPLEIIEEMRRVEGVSEENWDRRGVEVGDEAWKVLTDWAEAEVARREEEGGMPGPAIVETA